MRDDANNTDTLTSPIDYSGVEPEAWMRLIGAARIGILAFVAIGAIVSIGEPGARFLLVLFACGFFFGIWYLHTLESVKRLGRSQAWAQILLDFSVIALTVSYTQGPISFFTFLFAAVVLETVLLLGLPQGLIIATLASMFMLVHTVIPPMYLNNVTKFELWYNFLVQCFAFYLTAYVSGHLSRRLHRMQQFQREILDNMNSGFIITDANGIITVQNKAASIILGLGNDEAVGLPIDEVLRVESGDECPVTTAIRSGRDFTSYEFHMVTDAGDVRLLGITTNRIVSAEGYTTGVIVNFSDLTEINEIREELRRHDRLAVIGELAAGLAHEIRNPVSIIRGAVDELMTQSDSPELQEKLCGMAIREADHLNEIVTGFLDFARQPSIKGEIFDLCPLVMEVVHLLKEDRMDTNGCTIEVDCPDEPCEISGDPSQMKQVFVNLAQNGVEATEGQGSLRISISKESNSVEVRFVDDGPGVEPDKVARIFEPFYTTKDNGVGMGLAVCLRIVTAHDGTLRAFSRGTGGCSMSVRLPAARSGVTCV